MLRALMLLAALCAPATSASPRYGFRTPGITTSRSPRSSLARSSIALDNPQNLRMSRSSTTLDLGPDHSPGLVPSFDVYNTIGTIPIAHDVTHALHDSFVALDSTQRLRTPRTSTILDFGPIPPPDFNTSFDVYNTMSKVLGPLDDLYELHELSVTPIIISNRRSQHYPAAELMLDLATQNVKSQKNLHFSDSERAHRALQDAREGALWTGGVVPRYTAGGAPRSRLEKRRLGTPLNGLFLATCPRTSMYASGRGPSDHLTPVRSAWRLSSSLRLAWVDSKIWIAPSSWRSSARAYGSRETSGEAIAHPLRACRNFVRTQDVHVACQTPAPAFERAARALALPDMRIALIGP